MPVVASLPSQSLDRRGRWRRWILAAEAILVIAVLWLIGPPLAALRIARPVIAALFLVLLFWVCSFAVKLGIFFAVSWDDFRDVVAESLRASAPAMWFAPAILLLATPPHAAMALGLLLVGNTTRLLVSRNAPQKLAPAPPPEWTRRYRLFRDTAAPDVPFAKEMLSPVLGALAVQTGVCGIWGEYPLAAALLTACGAAIWTWASIARGAILRVENPRSSHWPLSILLSLLLTTSLSVAQLEMQPATEAENEKPSEILETMQRLWQHLEHSAAPPQAARRNAAKLVNPTPGGSKKNSGKKEIGVPGSYFAPGVILRSDVKPQHQWLVLNTPGHSRPAPPTVARELTIPFTGEYQVFPTSSARLKHEWAEESGSLLENAYITAGGGSLETQAYQKLDPPIDLANCGKLQLVIVSGEDGPFGAALQLLATDRQLDLGSEICGLDRRVEETLDFAVPARSGSFLVNGIRVSFQRLPRQGKQSMKVVVKRFTLIPRP